MKRLLDKGYGVLPFLSLSVSLNKLKSLLPKRFCDFSFPSLTEEGYIDDRSKFIAMLIRRWQKELDKSRRECEAVEKEPYVLWD